MPTAESVKLVLVAEVDQITVPVAQLAVKVNVFGEQTAKLGGLVIMGAVGLALISSKTGVLAALGQALRVQVAEIE